MWVGGILLSLGSWQLTDFETVLREVRAHGTLNIILQSFIVAVVSALVRVWM